MPINLDEALGAELPPAAEFSWTSSDIQLYHLGLGAGGDPMDKRELRYLTDDTPPRCCRRSATSRRAFT